LIAYTPMNILEERFRKTESVLTELR